MLTKGFKDEEQRQINQMFNAGFDLEFVPELWRNEERKKLEQILEKVLKITLNEIETCSTEDLLNKLNTRNLSFSNKETFADLLIKMVPVETEFGSELAQKAVAVYQNAQAESKTFSFGLVQKISQAKSLI